MERSVYWKFTIVGELNPRQPAILSSALTEYVKCLPQPVKGSRCYEEEKYPGVSWGVCTLSLSRVLCLGESSVTVQVKRASVLAILTTIAEPSSIDPHKPAQTPSRASASPRNLTSTASQHDGRSTEPQDDIDKVM